MWFVMFYGYANHKCGVVSLQDRWCRKYASNNYGATTKFKIRCIGFVFPKNASPVEKTTGDASILREVCGCGALIRIG